MYILILTKTHFYIIVTGVKERAHLDDSRYSMKEMMGLIALEFNNDEILLTLPSNAEDLDDYEHLDPNPQDRISLKRDWNWVKDVYKITLAEYKEVLHEWNKGTGGGTGLQDKFQTWSDEKLNKHDIDPSVYDHSDIASRPSILMEGYVKRKPYLTVIFMWDEMKDYILSSKYEPVRMGRNEAGLSSNESNSSPSRKTSNNSESSPNKNMASMVTDVITAVMGKKEEAAKKAVKNSNSFEDLPLGDIMMLIQEHKSYMTFLRECDMCTPERTSTIVREIDDLFEIVNKRKRKRQIDPDESNTDNNSISSKNSTVS